MISSNEYTLTLFLYYKMNINNFGLIFILNQEGMI